MADTIKPLSMEEMLPILQHLLADLQTQKAHAETQAADWTWKATCSVKGGGRDFRQRQALQWDALVESGRKHIAAVEQTIAILTVLNHPQFEGINHYWEACKPMFFRVALLDELGCHRCFIGDTVLEAILKAHEAIKASTPAPAPSPPGED